LLGLKELTFVSGIQVLRELNLVGERKNRNKGDSL